MAGTFNAYIFQMLGSSLFKGFVERVAMFDIHCCVSRAVDQQEGGRISCNISGGRGFPATFFESIGRAGNSSPGWVRRALRRLSNKRKLVGVAEAHTA